MVILAWESYQHSIFPWAMGETQPGTLFLNRLGRVRRFASDVFNSGAAKVLLEFVEESDSCDFRPIKFLLMDASEAKFKCRQR
jgi:hypothetical protein